MDGMPVYTDARVQHKLHQFRRPFSNTADWLSSPMKAEIFALSSTPPPSPSCVGEHRPDDSSLALKSMNKAVRLCSEYPGNNPVISTTWVSTEPFSFMFDDFSLSNFMINNNGYITGYIDFEVVAIVPLWKCATLPEWLQAEDHNDGWSERGGSEAEKQVLRDAFLREIDCHPVGVGWREAYEKGLPFRDFSRKLEASASFWHYDDEWVENRFKWAAKHPGLGCPENEEGFSGDGL